MNAKILLPILTFILLSASVMATSGLIEPVFDYAEGDWEVANPGSNAADYNYSNYGECSGYCFVMTNYTLTSYGGYYDIANWGINFTDVVDGEDGLSQPDCFASDQPFSTIIIINMSNMTETFLGCEDKNNPGTWLPLDDSYDITTGNVSGQYFYWTDNAPTVVLDDSINGTTKPCNDDFTRSSDLIFTATDNTDNEFRCCAYIDGELDLASCNSSISNNTESVLHTDALLEGDNTVSVACEDENGWGYSNSMTLRGEYCSCNASGFGDYIVFGILCAVLIFFAAYVFGGAEFFAQNWKYVIIFIAASLVLWWLENWNSLC